MAFGAPDTSEQFKVQEHEGSLALILVHTFTPQVPTAFGIKDVVRCEVALIDGPTAGQRFPDAMIFNSKMVPQLRGKVGSREATLGRIVKGQAKAGQNAPFILAEPTPQDIEIAQAWEKANGELKPAPVQPGNGGQQQGWPQPNGGYTQHQPPPYPGQGQGQPAYAGQGAASYTNQPPF